MASAPIGRQSLGFTGWLLVTFAAGSIGALASAKAGIFYGKLIQPAWAPPAWLFGPVWTVLYILMAVAAWLVWRNHGLRGASTALSLFVIQLFANALWTWLFFGLNRGALALAEIIVLWLLIVATIATFWILNRTAALMLVPYLAWVSFASVLTLALWRLNPAVLG